jgi:hypothetical protein
MHRERRAATRRVPDVDDTLARLRLRAGRELAVVEISDTGALVDTSGRLLPGTHVEVHVVTRDGRTLVRSRVTRAWVFAVAADALRYRAALVFETRVNTTPSRVALTHAAPREGAGAGNRYPNEETTRD